jgi:hypothetical protein
VVSRCLVWPEKKRYNRIYGDGGEFDAQLAGHIEAEGYDNNGDFSGARLLLHRHTHTDDDGFTNVSFVCPYLDRNNYVIPQGDYLFISAEQTPFGAQQQNGHTLSAVDCGEYGGWTNSENVLEFYGKPATYEWLDSSPKVFRCRDCNEFFWLTDQHHDKVCKTCYKDHEWAECTSCHNHFPSQQMHNGECHDCLRTSYRSPDPNNRPEPPYPGNWCRTLDQHYCGTYMVTHTWYKWRNYDGYFQIWHENCWRNTYISGKHLEYRKVK